MPIFLNLALFVPSIVLLLPLQREQSIKRKDKIRDESNSALRAGDLIVRPFLTNYRGAMLIATSIAILAVDFHVFPRRFAKVETWGTSLMDLGVGSFVFSAGVVGARSVIRTGQTTHIITRFIKSVRHSMPLIVLGTIRLISVKNLEYAEHVTEYGVHWNFFFTLASLPPFVELVDTSLGLIRTTAKGSQAMSIRYDLVAILIAGTFEIILNTTRLLSFILVAPRTPDSDLFTKNREGIMSFFGYLAIFLGGRSTGILVCQFQSIQTSKKATEAETISKERRQIILPQLLIRAAIYALAFSGFTSVHAFGLTVSRRLANLPYVLWILAFNNAQLLLFAFIEALGPQFTFSKSTVTSAAESASPIMRAFNKNGLALFLVANLGTGLVNLTMKTLDMKDARAMAVLIGYSGFLTVIAVLMDHTGIKLKL